VKGFYAKPKKNKKKLPVIVFNRGGNARFSVPRSRYIYGKLFPIVEKGFVVIGSLYRGAQVKGEKNIDASSDEFGGKDVNDILALLPIIDTFSFADKDNIGLWGVSRGGMMSYLAATQTSRFKTIVADSAPTNLFDEAERFKKVLTKWIPNYKKDKENQLKRRSVYFWPEKLKNKLPILLLHGARDKRVRVTAILEFALKLQAINHPYRLVVYEKEEHTLRKKARQVNYEIISWFSDKLIKK
jgi:dipeptidyl aminopeptidase/acylaminoacyl peptidase